MTAKTLVVRTKLVPPRLHRRILHRERLSALLAAALDYRLTILQAGAGYGKTTALAALQEGETPLAWYHLSVEDCDPLVFLLHLIYCFDGSLPGVGRTLAALLESESAEAPLQAGPGVVDALANELAGQLTRPMLVVLDDVHRLRETPDVLGLLDRLIERAPADVHFLFSSRYPVRLPSLVTWKARGEVQMIGQDALAFTTAEIAALFRERYGLSLSDEEIEDLGRETEGWAIAIQLYSQGLKSGAVSPAGRRGKAEALTLESLFDYLAQEVFARFSPDVREFLRVTAVLRELNVGICNAVRAQTDSEQYLHYLLENGLFVIDLDGETLRYHHLFREFILEGLPEEERRQLYERAGRCHLERGEHEEAVNQFLKAGNFGQTADILVETGERLVRAGRLEIFSKWIGSLPPDILESHPQLMVYLGDIARLRSRFDEALGWYRHAEEHCRVRGDLRGLSQALHGRARIYLDTVNPTEAELVLQEALRVSDGQSDRESRARLLELLAENRLNSGQLDQAEAFRSQARALREVSSNETDLSMRVLLRTGRIDRARQALEEQAEVERQSPIPLSRSHRETLLLLSIIDSIEGEAKKALDAALQGTQRGSELQSPFVIGVGYMRQGHALMLFNTPESYEQARHAFEKTVEISRSLDVSRLRVEACWGLCRAYGYQGDLRQALRWAEEGVHLAAQAGDGWMGSLVSLAMGASYILSDQFEAGEDWLGRAASGFEACSDPFGRSVARLWLCLGWLRQKKDISLAAALPEELAACRLNGADFLFARSTLLGPPDERLLVPLLIYAREHGWEVSYVNRLLGRLGLGEISLHPGYQLRVFTLGGFQVFWGNRPIPSSGWRREKARQLFEVLLSFRATPLDRDQVLELLWPGLDPATAQRNFKVALNALYQVLEPERDAGQESAYILREGTVYALRPGADLWVDADAFAAALRQGEALLETAPESGMGQLKEALAQYRGEYLPEERYETFAAAERERLAVLFLHAADRLCEAYLQCSKAGEAVELCQRILSVDDCWERAYRQLMSAYDLLGNRGMVARTYQHCLQTLRQELDVAPAPETETLYQRLIHLP